MPHGREFHLPVALPLDPIDNSLRQRNFFRSAPSLPLANLQERRVSDQTDVLQGTLDLLIMRTIALEPMHGWAIAQRIQQISDELLRVRQGSLYPALHRLEHHGWLVAECSASDNNRRARLAPPTPARRTPPDAQ